jgi:hypothetical protein
MSIGAGRAWIALGLQQLRNAPSHLGSVNAAILHERFVNQRLRIHLPRAARAQADLEAGQTTRSGLLLSQAAHS